MQGNLMSTKNRTRRATTRNIRFPNQMIEQINIALEQKRVQEFLSLSHWSRRRDSTSEKSIYIVKVKPIRVLPLGTGRYCKFSNCEGIAVVGLQFYHFPWQWQTACWLCHRLNSLDD